MDEFMFGLALIEMMHLTEQHVLLGKRSAHFSEVIPHVTHLIEVLKVMVSINELPT